MPTGMLVRGSHNPERTNPGQQNIQKSELIDKTFKKGKEKKKTTTLKPSAN